MGEVEEDWFLRSVEVGAGAGEVGGGPGCM